MQEKGIISTNQYVWLLYTIITSFSTLQIIGRLIAHAGRDAWLSVIIAWFVDVVLAVAYAYMGIRFPGESIPQYSITVLGNFWGRVIGLLFLLFFLVAASGFVSSICSLLTNQFFPKTSINVFLIICYILIAAGARKGLEAFARTSEIMGPIYLLSFIIILAMAAPLVHMDNLKPCFYQGILPSLTGAPFLLSYISICIMMGMFVPYCNKPRNGFKGKFIAVTLGSAIFMLLTVYGIGIFGAEESGNMVNVGLEITRMVSLGDSVQRLESIWLMVSVAACVLAAITLVWAFSLGVSQIANLGSYKPLVGSSAFLAYVISATSFTNISEINDFSNYVFPFIAVFVESGLELFLLLMAVVLKKRGSVKS